MKEEEEENSLMKEEEENMMLLHRKENLAQAEKEVNKMKQHILEEYGCDVECMKPVKLCKKKKTYFDGKEVYESAVYFIDKEEVSSKQYKAMVVMYDWVCMWRSLKTMTEGYHLYLCKVDGCERCERANKEIKEKQEKRQRYEDDEKQEEQERQEKRQRERK